MDFQGHGLNKGIGPLQGGRYAVWSSSGNVSVGKCHFFGFVFRRVKGYISDLWYNSFGFLDRRGVPSGFGLFLDGSRASGFLVVRDHRCICFLGTSKCPRYSLLGSLLHVFRLPPRPSFRWTVNNSQKRCNKNTPLGSQARIKLQ